MGVTYKQIAENSNSNSECVTSSVANIGSVTNRVYNHPHTFLDESYDVRHGWYNPTYAGSYLIPHPKESTDNYNIRKSASTYKNFLKQIVNTTVEPLFKNSFKFDVKLSQLTFGIAADNFINNFNIKLFTMESMKSFFLHDLTYTVIAPRNIDTIEINEALPDICNVKVENVRSDTRLKNNTMDFVSITYRTDKVYIDKDDCVSVPYYTTTEYNQNSFTVVTELYTDNNGKFYSGSNKDDSKEKNLTRLTIDDEKITGFYYETLPVIEFKAKIDTTRETTPEMHDLAIECWNYYNTASLYKEIERKATFPMMTYQSTGTVDDITVGVNNALIYGEGMNAPTYLELDISAHQELRAAKAETRQEIYKLYLQGLQTEETKFTSEDSNNISESLFFNKVNFLSEYLIDYTIKLFANVIYVMLDGKVSLDILYKLSKTIEMDFDFDFDSDSERGDIKFFQLLADLTEEAEDRTVRDLLIKKVSDKIEITDKPLQE